MTENGLECIGCILEDNSVSTYDNYEDEDGNVKVRINGKEINVNNTSDEDTINWDNKDVKIRINQEGVVIDAKEKK
jgi:glyceraldehyde-3-phosphate dehydrogenase/erythrose-4-phosphate dehydrogenase